MQYPSGTEFRVTLLGPEDRLTPVVDLINETTLAAGLAVEVAR